jgi:hypothetical protein
VLGVVVFAGASSGGDDGTGSTAPITESIAGTPLEAANESLTIPQSTQLGVEIGSTLPEVQKSTLAAPIAKGSVGGDVKKVQERLTELGFQPGPADGYFGDLTQQAVWAYKKLVMKIPRQTLDAGQSASLITPATWLTMQDPITIQPRRPQDPGETHVEIYLPEQVLIVFKDAKALFIAHIASGDDQEWCELVRYNTGPQGELLDEIVERDECGRSYTPGGVFRIKRFVQGIRESPLGSMYDPVYFNYGIAVHGAKTVPLHPASHGCIRLHRDLGVIFPTLVAKGNRVYVWGQDGREPEQYSRQQTLPIFNYPNPNSTTTSSSSTTSTVPKSTTTEPDPTTTKAPATTATPTATTTAATTPPTAAPTSPPTTAPPATAAPTTAAPATTAAPTTELTVPTP